MNGKDDSATADTDNAEVLNALFFQASVIKDRREKLPAVGKY